MAGASLSPSRSSSASSLLMPGVSGSAVADEVAARLDEKFDTLTTIAIFGNLAVKLKLHFDIFSLCP